MTGIRGFSTTAASNIDVGTVNQAEGMARADVNNAMRARDAELAKLLLDLGGAKATTGSANAYLLSLDTVPTAYANNLFFLAKSNHTNSGVATININGIGVKDIEKIVVGAAINLAAGDFPSGHRGMFIYSSSDNSVVLLNPANPLGGDNTITSAQLRLALTDETGSGSAVFATAPALNTPALTTPSFNGTPTGTVTADIYTPTITDGVNVDSSANPTGFFTRVADIVTVSGSVSVDATANATNTEIGISLPIASTVGTLGYDLIGWISPVGNPMAMAQVYENGTTAAAVFVSTSTSAVTYIFEFRYRVI